MYLYVSIKTDEKGNRPKHIWVLIAAPAPIGKQKYTISTGGSDNTQGLMIDGFMRPLKKEDKKCIVKKVLLLSV